MAVFKPVNIRAVGGDYYNWLVDTYAGEANGYSYLLARLHETPFRYCIMMDENREADGFNLIFQYAWKNNIPYDYLGDTGGPVSCSVLEFLCGVVYHVNYMLDDWSDDKTHDYFWIIIENMGLDAYDDSRFDPKEVDICVNRLLNRDFGPNGEGGLFTFNTVNGPDMQYVEFWKHITRYCHENRKW